MTSRDDNTISSSRLSIRGLHLLKANLALRRLRFVAVNMARSLSKKRPDFPLGRAARISLVLRTLRAYTDQCASATSSFLPSPSVRPACDPPSRLTQRSFPHCAVPSGNINGIGRPNGQNFLKKSGEPADAVESKNPRCFFPALKRSPSRVPIGINERLCHESWPRSQAVASLAP